MINLVHTLSKCMLTFGPNLYCMISINALLLLFSNFKSYSLARFIIVQIKYLFIFSYLVKDKKYINKYKTYKIFTWILFIIIL